MRRIVYGSGRSLWSANSVASAKGVDSFQVRKFEINFGMGRRKIQKEKKKKII